MRLSRLSVVDHGGALKARTPRGSGLCSPAPAFPLSGFSISRHFRETQSCSCSPSGPACHLCNTSTGFAVCCTGRPRLAHLCPGGRGGCWNEATADIRTGCPICPAITRLFLNTCCTLSLQQVEAKMESLGLGVLLSLPQSPACGPAVPHMSPRLQLPR